MEREVPIFTEKFEPRCDLQLGIYATKGFELGYAHNFTAVNENSKNVPVLNAELSSWETQRL